MDLAILKMISVKLRGPLGIVSTIALSDNGSTTTLIDGSLAKRIGLQKAQILRYAVNGKKEFIVSKKILKLWPLIASANGKKFFNLKKVRTVKHIDLPTQNWDIEELKKDYPYITEVDLSGIKSGKPLILVGWIIHGPVESLTNGKNHSEVTLICATDDFQDLHDEVKKYFSLENFKVTNLRIMKSLLPKKKGPSI